MRSFKACTSLNIDFDSIKVATIPNRSMQSAESETVMVVLE